MNILEYFTMKQKRKKQQQKNKTDLTVFGCLCMWPPSICTLPQNITTTTKSLNVVALFEIFTKWAYKSTVKWHFE